MGKNPRVRIGLRELAAQPPGPFILWDTEIHGLCARRQFSETITYSVIYRTKEGQQRWLKLGHHGVWTPTQARDKARQVRFMADNGQDPANEKYQLRSGATVSELCDQYIVTMQSSKKLSTIKSDKSRIENHIRVRLGKFRVAAISQEQIEQFSQSMSAGSARRILALLNTMFTFAIKKGLRQDNPVKLVKKPVEFRKTRRLHEIEYQQLSAALKSNATVQNDIFLFLALTGWRSNEARCLKHSEIDTERRIITLGDTKSGKSIRPISQAALQIIQKQERISEYVFTLQHGRQVSNLALPWKKLAMSKDVSPHVLRHSYASLSADLGLPDHTIARLLGHKQSSITSRYIHMEKAIIEASDLVATEVLRLMRKGPGI